MCCGKKGNFISATIVFPYIQIRMVMQKYLPNYGHTYSFPCKNSKDGFIEESRIPQGSLVDLPKEEEVDCSEMMKGFVSLPS